MIVLCLCVVEWSCLKDFSLLAGETVLDDLQTLRCAISGLTTVEPQPWPPVCCE